MMSDEVRIQISAIAKALCHYPSGPSSVNSCCQGIARCEMDAAIGEITRLRAEVATARREGMEEAAQMMIDLRQETTWEEHPEYGQICVIRNRTSEEIATAIRAATKEGKP